MIHLIGAILWQLHFIVRAGWEFIHVAAAAALPGQAMSRMALQSYGHLTLAQDHKYFICTHLAVMHVCPGIADFIP